MNDKFEPIDDARSGRDEFEPSAPQPTASDAPRPPGTTARRSRPSPGMGMVKSIEAFDDFSSISIRPSSKPSAESAEPSIRRASPEKEPPATAAVREQTASAPRCPVVVGQNIAREPTHESGPHLREPAVETDAWPQWLLAVALFAGAFWYLLSVEPSEQSPTREPPADDRLPHE